MECICVLVLISTLIGTTHSNNGQLTVTQKNHIPRGSHLSNQSTLVVLIIGVVDVRAEFSMAKLVVFKMCELISSMNLLQKSNDDIQCGILHWILEWKKNISRGKIS